MNKVRRGALQRVCVKIQDASTDLQRVIDQESNSIDNIPENLTYSNKAQNMEESLNYLLDASSSLSDALGSISDAM